MDGSKHHLKDCLQQSKSLVLGWWGGWMVVKAVLRIAHSNKKSYFCFAFVRMRVELAKKGGKIYRQVLKVRSKTVFLDGWIDGWVAVKAVLRIAYSNQKSYFCFACVRM